MMDNQPPLPTHHRDGIQSMGTHHREMSRPLYSRDSTQEGHTIPHHHQSGNLRDPKVEDKEEIKEEEDEDGGMEETELLKKAQRSCTMTPWWSSIQLTGKPTREMSPVLCNSPGFHTEVTPSSPSARCGGSNSRYEFE
ncbi:unnamed protein product [Staurois parvus]|uniref:Uncharacterized protein n=1 Tax=Staurois parvus TaxID=386267 RepID=A0ABN9BVY0_9NEOB|nr:unnamed protein product [Staurois parvus]